MMEMEEINVKLPWKHFYKKNKSEKNAGLWWCKNKVSEVGSDHILMENGEKALLHFGTDEWLWLHFSYLQE